MGNKPIKSYLGARIKEQLTDNLNNKEDRKKAVMSYQTLKKYWYNNRYTPPSDDAYYFVGRKNGVSHYILERDEAKSPSYRY